MKNKDDIFSSYKFLDKAVFVNLNGDIDNFEELKKYLCAHYSFIIQNQEALIGAMFIVYGESFVTKLCGAFVIAIRFEASLFLYRDRIGLRHVYYTQHGDFSFLNFKELLECRSITPLVNANFIAETLIFGFQISNETPINGIYLLPKGSYIRFDNKKMQEIKSYIVDSQTCEQFSSEKLRKFVENNISKYKKYSVKNICLSGGVDSSVVALLIHTLSDAKDKIFSYTLTSESPQKYDELYAKCVADYINSEHYTVNVSVRDMFENLIEFIMCSEIPGLSGIYLPNGELAFYLLLKHVKKQGGNLIFTGDGVEKLFRTFSVPKTSWIKQFCNRYKYAKKIIGCKNENIEYFFEQWKLDSLTAYEWLLNYEWLEQIQVGNKIAEHNNLHLVSPFLEEKVVYHMDRNYKYWLESLQFSIGDKTQFQNIFSDLFTTNELKKIMYRKKEALPTAISSLQHDFLREIESSYFPVVKGPYDRLFYNKYEKFVFDLFFYIFIQKKGTINPECLTLKDLVNDPKFKYMYD